MTSLIRRAVLAVCLCMLGATATIAQDARTKSKDPPVPAGTDPGGVAVAIISHGVNYRRPEISDAVARDGEGLIIGWDFIDNDEKPFEPATANAKTGAPSGSTADAIKLLSAARQAGTRIRLVVTRVDITDLKMRAAALAYIAQTPARIVLAAHWPLSPERKNLLHVAAKHIPHLFIVAQMTAAIPKTPAPPTTVFADSDATVLVVRAARYLSTNPSASAVTIKKHVLAN